nr:lysozyme inhibitor LprI family protein [Deinococcus xianganensis]
MQKTFNPSGCETDRSGFRAWSWQIGGVPICQRNRRNPYQTQRNWMKERDSTCVGVNERWGSVVYSDCAARKTVERLNFLNDRLRECLSTGCQPSRIR